MPENDPETLAQYVTRTIKEKGLKHHEVKENSGGRITDGYVRGIMTGSASNPSVKKLQALARGLNVDEDEIFRVARGLPIQSKTKYEEDETHVRTIALLLLGSMKSASLRELLSEVVRMPPDHRQEAVNALKFLNSRKPRTSRAKKKH